MTSSVTLYCFEPSVFCVSAESFSPRNPVGGPIGLKSMQNTTFLVLLRPIFAPKMKIAPPNGVREQKLGRTCCCLEQKSVVFFFWTSP